MTPHAYRCLKINLTLPLLGLVGLVGIQPAVAQAQIETLVNFQPPPTSAPGNREAGGVRSDTCASVTEQSGLTAIVPETNVGLTTKAAPQLFAYIPTNSAQVAELRLFNESTGEEVFAGTVQMPAADAGSDHTYKASILNMALPSSVALEPNESYLWALMLVCNSENRAEDIVVTAVVQRAGDEYLNTLPADVSTKLNGVNSASGDEKVAIYSSAGLWNDLLAELATMVKADPTNYEPVWSGLLTNQGLGAISDAPVHSISLTPISPL